MCVILILVLNVQYSLLIIFNKGGCLVSSLSTAHARLHWVKIYIVVVMYYKNVQVLSTGCNDFPLECHIR